MVVFIQSYNRSITILAALVSHTDSLERLLKITDKVIRLRIQMHRVMETVCFAGFGKLHCQLRDSIEILGVMQSIHLIEQLTCPNEKGSYFFQRMPWKRNAERVFLACYSCLSNTRWLEQLGFIELRKIGHKFVGNLSVLKLITDCSYIFYRIFVIGQAIQTKTWWKVAMSIGKIFVVIMTLATSAWNLHPLGTLGLTGLSLSLDIWILKHRICHD